MERNYALGGILFGLLAGALLGAGIFSLTGSLNLGLGFTLMIIGALMGSVTGWFVAPIYMKWREKQIKPITEREEYKGILTQQNQEGDPDPSTDSLSGTFHVDFIRLGGFALLYSSLSVGFIFLIWYQGISYWYFVIFFLVLALFNLGKLMLYAGTRLEINAQGFEHKIWGESRMIGWDDIDFIWETYSRIQFGLFPLQYTHHIKLDLYDGSTLKLNRNLGHFSTLTNLIQRGATSFQLPIALSRLENGGTIDFGVFKLNDKGLYFKNKNLVWSDIDRIVVMRERVQVQKTGKQWLNWADVKGWEVPNLRLFVLLANNHTKVI
jgi:hypothetical protein